MTHVLKTILANYNWLASLTAAVAIVLGAMALNRLLALIPTFRKAQQANKAALAKKMERPAYAANHKWNRSWSGFYMLVIFGAILPFCVSFSAQAWWRTPLDIVVILMVYDFVYYFTHRFVFHDNGFLGGPMLQVHGVHHRQHNPCRMDASYIHPAEVGVGLGLFVATIFVLSRFMGDFPVTTIVICWITFQELNLHNHDLWEADQFPFKYLNYASALHHFHHIKFTGGNFATISPLYDWLFGTLDHGKGYRSENKVLKPKLGQ